MKIKIPENNIQERSYIIDILIGEFLGLPYSIEVGKYKNYHLKFEDKEVVIEDHFFNFYQEDLSYLKMDAIPNKVKFTENQFIWEHNIPVLFGNEKMHVEEHIIVCGNDIFAASFFMLTRWEEYVFPVRDPHNRYPAYNSLAYKFQFLDRPIVNEYVEMLWQMLITLGLPHKRKDRDYKFFLTHDVDHLRYFTGFESVGRKIAGDIFKRKKFNTTIPLVKEYFDVKSGKKKDPYDTFNWIMDYSEKENIQSRFYFMSSGSTRYDSGYDIKGYLAESIISNIKDRNHIIGFHPSYYSYNNPKLWKEEKNLLEEVVKYPIKEGRQHYLRFEAPFTWEIWNENGMDTDMSLSYAEKEGFRCGVCYEYSVFDFIRRKKLSLKESPLIAMEVTFRSYQQLTPTQMYNKVSELIKIVKRYSGNFVFLWHNSSLELKQWYPYKEIYKSIISK